MSRALLLVSWGPTTVPHTTSKQRPITEPALTAASGVQPIGLTGFISVCSTMTNVDQPVVSKTLILYMQRFEDSSPCQQLRLLYLCTVFLFAFTATFNTHFDDSQIGDGAQSPEGNPKVSRPRWETCSQCRPTTRLS
jgi:hypothetical protein